MQLPLLITKIGDKEYVSSDVDKVLPKCKDHALGVLPPLNKMNYHFPVVYDPKYPSNVEILLFNSLFEKYNVTIPYSLKGV